MSNSPRPETRPLGETLRYVIVRTRPLTYPLMIACAALLVWNPVSGSALADLVTGSLVWNPLMLFCLVPLLAGATHCLLAVKFDRDLAKLSSEYSPNLLDRAIAPIDYFLATVL